MVRMYVQNVYDITGCLLSIYTSVMGYVLLYSSVPSGRYVVPVHSNVQETHTTYLRSTIIALSLASNNKLQVLANTHTDHNPL